MHNQSDRSMSVGQVQTDYMFDDTEELDGLPVVERDGATEVWKAPDGIRTRQPPTARSRLYLASGRKRKIVGHAVVLGASRPAESVRPRGQQQSARIIERTRSGKTTHDMDLKVLGAAHIRDEAGATPAE